MSTDTTKPKTEPDTKTGKIEKCSNCGFTLFDRIDPLTFKCQNCGTLNTFIVKDKINRFSYGDSK